MRGVGKPKERKRSEWFETKWSREKAKSIYDEAEKAQVLKIKRSKRRKGLVRAWGLRRERRNGRRREARPDKEERKERHVCES